MRGLISLIVLLSTAWLFHAQSFQHPRIMWQNVPIIAFLNGFYTGTVTVAEAQKHGDLGLGAFADLDGEMVSMDGAVYQITADGKVHKPTSNTLLSYALMTHFEADRSARVPVNVSFATIVRAVLGEKQTPNAFYAIRLTGIFASVQTRAVPRQKIPYPPFCEVIKTQSTFHFSDVAGTMAGFIGPAYVSTMDTSGLHLHFLTKDGQAGGHVLAFTAKDVTAELERMDRMQVDFPRELSFQKNSLSDIATCR